MIIRYSDPRATILNPTPRTSDPDVGKGLMWKNNHVFLL